MSSREEMKKKMLDDMSWIKKWTPTHLQKGIDNSKWYLANAKDATEEALENTRILIEVFEDELAARQREPTYDPK